MLSSPFGRPLRLTLIAANARFVHAAPSLFYLRNVLERRLPESLITLHQFTINDPYYETLLAVLADKPDVVLVSAYVWNDALLRRLLSDLRRVRPELALVAGGPQAPHLRLPPEVALTVVRGPVEGLGADFFAGLAAGNLAPDYQAEAAAPFAMPYREEDFAGELQNRQLYYESSRGCPFACAYCLSAARAGVDYLPLEQVEEELARLLTHQPTIIRFVDRTFNSPPQRALALWRWLAARPEPTRFHFEIAPDLFTDEQLDFLATVAKGSFQFEIGLQSFNPAALAAVNRRPDLGRARENIRRLAAAANIHLHLDLILGLPFDGRAEYLASLNQILALKPHHLQLGLLKLLPDTPLARQQQEFGLICCREPPYPILATRWLSQPELAELFHLGEVIEAFYNPRYFRTTLTWLLEREPEPVAFFRDLAELCRRRRFFARAKTHELLSELLSECCRKRSDGELLLELLRFDWLACAHRRLLEHLLPPQFPPAGASAEQVGAAWLKESQDRLWRRLPDNYPPLFTPRSRSAFFKRTVFAPFSAGALRELGLDNGGRPGVVAFLAEQDGSLAPRQGIHLFPDD